MLVDHFSTIGPYILTDDYVDICHWDGSRKYSRDWLEFPKRPFYRRGHNVFVMMEDYAVNTDVVIDLFIFFFFKWPLSVFENSVFRSLVIAEMT